VGLGAYFVSMNPTSGKGNTSSNPSTITQTHNFVVDAAGVRGDLGFIDLAALGASEAQKEFGVNVKFVSTPDTSQLYSILQGQAQSGTYDLIITVGFEFADVISQVASQYPNQKFAIIDAIPSKPEPNIEAVYYAANESSALAGVIAAAYDKTGKVGIVLGPSVPVLYGFVAGFVYGVNWYENYSGKHKNITINAYFTTSFSDPSQGTTATQTMVTNGYDVIAAWAGGTGLGVFDYVKQYDSNNPSNPVYVLGVDSDQRWILPLYTLTGPLKRVDLTVVFLIQQVLNGTFKGGVILGDLKNGLVGLPNPETLNETLTLGLAANKFNQTQMNVIISEVNSIYNSPYYQSILKNYVSVLEQLILQGKVSIPYPQSRDQFLTFARQYGVLTNA